MQIFFPSRHMCPLQGGAEVRLEGQCWTSLHSAHTRMAFPVHYLWQQRGHRAPILQSCTSQAPGAHADPNLSAGGRYWSAFWGWNRVGRQRAPSGWQLSLFQSLLTFKGGKSMQRLPVNSLKKNEIKKEWLCTFNFYYYYYHCSSRSSEARSPAAPGPALSRRCRPRRLQGEPGGRASAAWGAGGRRGPRRERRAGFLLSFLKKYLPPC